MEGRARVILTNAVVYDHHIPVDRRGWGDERWKEAVQRCGMDFGDVRGGTRYRIEEEDKVHSHTATAAGSSDAIIGNHRKNEPMVFFEAPVVPFTTAR